MKCTHNVCLMVHYDYSVYVKMLYIHYWLLGIGKMYNLSTIIKP